MSCKRNYGLGTPKKEKYVREGLTKWLEDELNATVYYGENETGVESRERCTPDQNKTRPDMVVDTDRHVVVIEVKSTDSVGQVCRGPSELFDYWRADMNTGLTYTPETAEQKDDETLEADLYLLATDSSPYGCLFTREWEETFPASDAEEGELPEHETGRTATLTRILWNFGENYADAFSLPLGVLLSSQLDSLSPWTSLDEPDGIGRPYAQFKSDGKQRWEELL
jgi:hypothetical protein